MNRCRPRWQGVWLAVLAGLAVLPPPSPAADPALYVSPSGDDGAEGTQQAPFRTLHRARDAVRSLARDMQSDIVVNVAPGEYRLDRTLEFTEADSGRNGFRVVYRSAAGPG